MFFNVFSHRCVAALAVVLVSSVNVLAQSQTGLRGEVVAPDGSRLPGATVVVRPATMPAADGSTRRIRLTDASGRFSFLTLGPGEYLLTASAEGFAARDLRVPIEPREVRSLVVSLDLATVDVSVDVVGEATWLASTFSPSSTVLTHERLEQAPPFQRATLADAMATAAPGMVRGHDDFVHVRGQEVALNPIINGVAFWENPHALFSPGVDLGAIDTANVMTGGFPAEYGNRFGGVVDLVTRSGAQLDRRGSATIGAGGLGRRRAEANTGGGHGWVNYFASGSILTSDRFLSPPDPEVLHDQGRSGHLFGQLDGSAGDDASWRLVVMGDGLTLEIPRTADDRELRPDALPRLESRQQTAIGSWTRLWPAATSTVSVYQRWSDADLSPAEGALTAAARYDRSLVTVGGRVDATALAGRHTVKFGLDVVRLRPAEDLSYDYGGYRELTHLLGLPHIHIHENHIDFTGRESGGQISAYAQTSFTLGAGATVDAGMRVDHYALVTTATHVSPRLNLALRAGRTLLHGSYNRYFVPPPIEGLLISSAGLTEAISEIGVALPPLEPTVEDQVEFGASRALGAVRASATSYYRRTDNPVHTTVWPDARLYSYASFDRAKAYGLEVKADLPGLVRDGVTGYLNYALGRVYFYNPVTGGFVTEAEHIKETNRFFAPMDQTHTLTGGVTYRHDDTGLWVGGTVEYGSGTPRGHGGDHDHGEADEDHDHAEAAKTAGRVPGHWTAGVSFGLDLLRDADRRPRLSLRVDVENVRDRIYLTAQEGEFTPSQYSSPRVASVTAAVSF